MQPLPVLAPGPADLLGCGRHRGSPPPLYAWLRLLAPPSHTEGEWKRKKKSLFPFLLPKPSEANWCTHLHPFFPLRCELMLGSPFLFLLVLPSLTWIWLSSHPSFFFSASCSQCAPTPLLPTIFGFIPHLFFHFLLIPCFSLTYFCSFEPARTLILSGWLFSWSCTVNSTGHWRNSLCCIRTGTNNTQVIMVVLTWTRFISLLS